MTRFARAKGSKSSNERAPEDSTPWEVMKEQLMQSKKEKEESSKRQEAENQRVTNYENFLKEQKVSKRKATWCDFPEEHPKKRLLPLKQAADNKLQETGVNESADAPKSQEKSKKKKKKNRTTTESSTSAPTEAMQLETSPDTEAPQTEKKQKKKNKNKQNANKSTENIAQTEKTQKSNVADKPFPNKNNLNPNKQTENNMKNKKKGKMSKGKPARRKVINDQSFQLIINTKEVELVRFDGFPIMKKDAERLTELRNSMIQKGIPKSEVQRTMKLERRRAEKALARLKRDVCYNCRKGGHNLSDCPELKSKIPGVDAADGICFKCGSTEHRQFECKVQRDKEFRFATCFICREQCYSGSGFRAVRAPISLRPLLIYCDHHLLQFLAKYCKLEELQDSVELKKFDLLPTHDVFAQNGVTSEDGHLARQCPDNPKGLYPNGGSCKLCGDVTHLRKDCPTTQGEREDTSLKLGTLESTDNIEDIGQQVKAVNSTAVDKKKIKKINF